MLIRLSSVRGRTKYDGPKKYAQIIRQIKQDSGGSISEEHIDRVVRLFFSNQGLGKLLKQDNSFRIGPLGTFQITPNEKKRRIEYRRRKWRERLDEWERRKKIRLKKKRKIRKWNEHNEFLIRYGQKPIPLEKFSLKKQGKK